jgi:hypothetical protein
MDRIKWLLPNLIVLQIRNLSIDPIIEIKKRWIVATFKQQSQVYSIGLFKEIIICIAWIGDIKIKLLLGFNLDLLSPGVLEYIAIK